MAYICNRIITAQRGGITCRSQSSTWGSCCLTHKSAVLQKLRGNTMRIQHESCRFTNMSVAAILPFARSFVMTKKSCRLTLMTVLSNLVLSRHNRVGQKMFCFSSGSTSSLQPFLTLRQDSCWANGKTHVESAHNGHEGSLLAQFRRPLQTGE